MLSGPVLRSNFLKFGQAISLGHARTLSVQTTVKPYYITTPIFYPNAVPHIGHLYSLVTADIFARFQRVLDPNRPVQFLAGTDEHGLKIQKAAKEQGLEPLLFCDRISERFRSLASKANISNTGFIRTTEREHYAAVNHVWRQLAAKGLIYKGRHAGWYSVADECFYTDSQISRITAGASESETVISIETGSTVEWMEEENYMFQLSSFRESLLAHYKADESSIHPPHHHAHIVDILSLGQLEDLSISRPRSRLSWGVPVPGDPNHTVYVWFDALIVYLTGLGYPWTTLSSMASGWPPNLQVIGKDILRFHAIYFPAMLCALDLPLPKRLLAHAHWTVKQKKMSKSVGNVADPFEAIDRFGIDVLRYYMARVGGRFKDDVDWSEEQLMKYDDEIQSYIGNFFLRVTSDKITSLVMSVEPRTLNEVFQASSKGPSGDPNRDVIAGLVNLGETVKDKLQNMEVGEALQQIVDMLKLANAAMTAIKPWSREPHVAQASYVTSLETLRVCGICLQPFVPGVATSLLDALGVPAEERTWASAGLTSRGSSEPLEGNCVRVVTRGARFFERSYSRTEGRRKGG